MDFRHLMVKGLELKKNVKGASEKCVIYMDVTCRTFFCAKQKNAANANAYRVEEISEARASGDNEKIISIAHKDGSLDLEVSSPKVRCERARGERRYTDAHTARVKDKATTATTTLVCVVCVCVEQT